MANEERGQGEDLVVVFRAQDQFTASVVQGILTGEGIPAVIESRQVPWMDGVMRMGEGYWGDVVVPRDHADRSRQLIDAYQADEGGDA